MCLKGRPSDNLLEVALVLEDGIVEEEEGGSLSLVVRFPYLFFRYRAQELRAAPSFSAPARSRSGLGSLDLSAWVLRLLASSEPAPYFAAK